MEKNLRLRLVVRRHALPEVRVVFTVSLDDDPTVAKLLERLNETIPLESGEWGLEDYVVELRDREGRAFECLHFQSVAEFLERDDLVYVRPLFTDDLRRRRLSGRHQITSDGKHLVDGVPFGRPRLKAPRDRPTIDIPPRKRRRLVYDGSDDDSQELPTLLLTEHGEEEGPTSVKVVADFVDAGSDDDEDEDLDGDFETEAEEDAEDDLEIDFDKSELDEELRDLQSEAGTLDDDETQPEDDQEPEHEEGDTPRPTPLQTHSASRGLYDVDYLDKLTALRSAFTTAPVEECEKYLSHYSANSKKAYGKLKKMYKPTKSFQEMRAFRKSLAPMSKSTTVRESVGDAEKDSDAESVSSVVKHYDQHGFPSGSIGKGTASAELVQAFQRAGQEIKAPVHLRFDQTVRKKTTKDRDNPRPDAIDDSELELPDSDDDPSNDEDSSSSDGSEPEELSAIALDHTSATIHDTTRPRRANPTDGSNSDTSGASAGASSDEDSTHDVDSDGNSDSDSDGDSDEESTAEDRGATLQVPKKRARTQTDEESTSDTDEDSDSTDVSSSASDSSSDDEKSEEADSDSGEDEVERAVRGPADAAHIKVQATTLLSTTTNPSVASAEMPDREQTSARTTIVSSTPPGEGKSKTSKRNERRRNAKKMAKLQDSSLQDMDTVAASASLDSDLHSRKQALLDSLVSQPNSAPGQLEADDGGVGATLPPNDGADSAKMEISPTQRRSRLDIGAGRRLIFGAIGMRNPKTKDDEEQIRSRLMKDVRPLVNPRTLEPSLAYPEKDAIHGEEQPVENDSPEAWRDKVTYRAVECCQDGIELSEPPFPFVQRWDPQQKVGKQDEWLTGRGRGQGKRKQRNQVQYYEDNAPGKAHKKRRLDAEEQDTSFFDGYSYDDTWYAGNNDDGGWTEEESSNEGVQSQDLDNFPPLPANLDALPELLLAEAKKGMFITWKEMVISEATRWQPTYVDLMALVMDADGDGFSDLQVQLAKRHRRKKTYDEEGNRVYGRFEVPDENEEDDDGLRSVAFSDMHQPRIVQRPVDNVPELVQSREFDEPNTARTKDSMRGIGDFPDAHTHSRDQAATNNDNETIMAFQKASIGAAAADLRSQESVVPETNLEESAERFGEDNLSGQSASHQSAQFNPVEDVSISEDRRHDISQLISDAGFRKDITPSIVHARQFDLSSPSRQLGDTMQAAAASSKPTSKAASPMPSRRSAGSSRCHVLAQFDGPALEELPVVDTPGVVYPQLNVSQPSQSGSLRSGRQPDFSLDTNGDSHDHFEDTADESLHTGGILPQDSPASEEISVRSQESQEAIVTRTPKKAAILHSDPPSATSSLPSLGDIFCTASTSRSSQSRTKPAVTSSQRPRRSLIDRDIKYEEDMRKFLEDDVSSPETTDHIYSLSQDALSAPSQQKTTLKQISPPARGSKLATKLKPTTKASTQPVLQSSQLATRRTTRASSDLFQIPAGSQVVSLLSSSPARAPLLATKRQPDVTAAESNASSIATESEMFLETYAEDSIDQTYEGRVGSPPTGSGWVRKAERLRRSPRRGRSLPATSVLDAESVIMVGGSQGQEQGAGRGRRKTALRF